MLKVSLYIHNILWTFFQFLSLVIDVLHNFWLFLFIHTFYFFLIDDVYDEVQDGEEEENEDVRLDYLERDDLDVSMIKPIYYTVRHNTWNFDGVS